LGEVIREGKTIVKDPVEEGDTCGQNDCSVLLDEVLRVAGNDNIVDKGEKKTKTTLWVQGGHREIRG